jgi:integrase
LGIPKTVVLYCARHRFSTDAMEGTGNVMAVMDAMGHGSVNTTRIYTHSNVQQIREAIERRNQLLAARLWKLCKSWPQKWPQSPEATLSGNVVSD